MQILKALLLPFLLIVSLISVDKLHAPLQAVSAPARLAH